MKLQFWFGWVFIYLTKCHSNLFASEIEFEDNVTDRFTLGLDYSQETCSCVERQMLFGEDRQISRAEVLN